MVKSGLPNLKFARKAETGLSEADIMRGNYPNLQELVRLSKDPEAYDQGPDKLGKLVLSALDELKVPVPDKYKADFDESEHPRDEHGKFSDSGTTASALPDKPKRKRKVKEPATPMQEAWQRLGSHAIIAAGVGWLIGPWSAGTYFVGASVYEGVKALIKTAQKKYPEGMAYAAGDIAGKAKKVVTDLGKGYEAGSSKHDQIGNRLPRNKFNPNHDEKGKFASSPGGPATNDPNHPEFGHKAWDKVQTQRPAANIAKEKEYVDTVTAALSKYGFQYDGPMKSPDTVADWKNNKTYTEAHWWVGPKGWEVMGGYDDSGAMDLTAMRNTSSGGQDRIGARGELGFGIAHDNATALKDVANRYGKLIQKNKGDTSMKLTDKEDQELDQAFNYLINGEKSKFKSDEDEELYNNTAKSLLSRDLKTQLST